MVVWRPEFCSEADLGVTPSLCGLPDAVPPSFVAFSISQPLPKAWIRYLRSVIIANTAMYMMKLGRKIFNDLR